jgi:hypothetical protein
MARACRGEKLHWNDFSKLTRYGRVIH